MRSSDRPLHELLLVQGTMEGPFYRPSLRRWIFSLLKRIWNELP